MSEQSPWQRVCREWPGFLSTFCPRRGGGGRGEGKMRLYELLGGGHALLGNFDFGHFIMRNLVKSGTVFAQT